MSKNNKPSLPNKYLGKVKWKKKAQSSQLCTNGFTIFWVNQAGRNFNTSGFACRVFVNGVLIAVRRFNRFGQVCFPAINIPLSQSVTIQTFRIFDGLIFRQRFIPVFTGSFAIIG